jgi:hypothetical protein
MPRNAATKTRALQHSRSRQQAHPARQAGLAERR